MIKILGSVFVLVMIIIIPPVSADLEVYNGEFYFTTPGPAEVRNFERAKSWCATHSSQLAVVRDTYTQMALTQFLNSSHLNSTIYMNIRHYRYEHAWNLLSGENYTGGIANANDTDYRMFCCLRYIPNGFTVEAARANNLKHYICHFEYNKCSKDSADRKLYNEICYVKYENENVTWHQAREKCLNNGGGLATFSNIRAPFDVFWLNPSLTYWVGIRRNKWSWKYPEGNEAIYTSWSKGYPNDIYHFCVCVDPNAIPPWSWTDCNCTVERQFVCLKIVPTTGMTATTTTTPIACRTTATSLSTVTYQHCELIPLQQCKSEALTLGLALGIGVILPLIIIVLVLVICIVRLNRRSRENTQNSRTATANISQPDFGRSTMELVDIATDVDYQKLQMELGRPESESYEVIPQNR